METSSGLTTVNAKTQAADDDYENSLLKAIFFKDTELAKRTIASSFSGIHYKDKHGNTPLHIAVMTGQKEIIQQLLAKGAAITVKNVLGWSPLNEAISCGDPEIVGWLLSALRAQWQREKEPLRQRLVQQLHAMRDCSFDIKWDLHSWLPLISRILPSDVWRISKKGCRVRFDSTLVDFKNFKWQRGDVSLLFDGQQDFDTSFVMMDNEERTYQRIDTSIKDQPGNDRVRNDVNRRLGMDNISAQISLSRLSVARTSTGVIDRRDRTELFENYSLQFYSIKGMEIEFLRRQEHLLEKDLKRNKMLKLKFLAAIKSGNMDFGKDLTTPTREAALPAPPSPLVSWKQYSQAEPGLYPPLARNFKLKTSSRSFRATVGLSKDFPLSITSLLDLIEVMAPLKELNIFQEFKNFREAMSANVPEGFPVKIELPVFPTVTLRITFQAVCFDGEQPESQFQVPTNYTHDSTHFQFLESS